MLTDVIIWISTGLLLAVVALTAVFAVLQRPRDHGRSIDEILREIADRRRRIDRLLAPRCVEKEPRP